MNEQQNPVAAGAQDDAPQLFALTRVAGGYKLARRDFLKVAGVVALATGTRALGAGGGGLAAASTSVHPAGNKMLVAWPAKGSLPKAHRAAVRGLAFGPDGRVLASGSRDGTIRLWSLPDGKLQATFREHPVNAVAISLDGKWLVSGGNDYAIQLRSLPVGTVQTTFKGGIEEPGVRAMGAVNALAVTPDGKWLASGSRGSAARLWSMPDGQLLASFRDQEEEGRAGPENLTTLTRRSRASLPASSAFGAVAFTPDGRLLALGSRERCIQLRSLPDGRLQATLKDPGEGATAAGSDAVNALAVTPDGKWLVSGVAEKTIRLWSLPDGKLRATLSGHSQAVNSVAVSPDGTRLASGSTDKTVRLWLLPAGTSETTLTGHSGIVHAVTISPDGQLLASADSEGVILLWELDGAKRRWVLFDPDLLHAQTKYSGFDQHGRIMGGLACTCDQVCTCNTIWVPAGMGTMGGVCVCNTITMGSAKSGGETETKTTRTMVGSDCTCNTVCTCDTVCTCNTISRPSPSPSPSSSGGGGSSLGGGHYWRPN